MAITPLNFWVQPVIPLTFDDSISYLETLGKVVEKLNESLTQNEDWATELRKDITDFTTKIENEMATFKAETNADISSFKNRISAQISTFEQQMNTKYSTFKNEITALVNSISTNPDYSIDHDSLNMWDVWGSGAKLNYKLNISTGAEEYANGRYISGYIPVTPNKKYAVMFGKQRGSVVIDDQQYIVIYDKNKSFVKSDISTTMSPTTFTIPTIGYYIRICISFVSTITPKVTISSITEMGAVVCTDDLPIVNNEPDYSWFSAPEAFKTSIMSTTTDDNAVYKRKISNRDILSRYDTALYENVVGSYDIGAYNVTTGEFNANITNAFTSDFIPVRPSEDDICITNPLNTTDYANVIYFDESKNIIGMYKYDIKTITNGVYIQPILYNDVAFIKFSGLIDNHSNCRVTANGVPSFGSGTYPDTLAFNNCIIVSPVAKIIRCGLNTYTGSSAEASAILRDCIYNGKPIYFLNNDNSVSKCEIRWIKDSSVKLAWTTFNGENSNIGINFSATGYSFG